MLKPLNQIAIPDERQAYFNDPDTLTPVTLELHHRDLALVELSGATPSEIREAFDRARNAFLYSWYVYELGSLAEMQAYATLEMALRIRLGVKPKEFGPGLSKLLKDAVGQGLIVDPQARHQGGIAYFIATLRNTWGHGSSNLHDPGTTLQLLRLCADMINQLFP